MFKITELKTLKLIFKFCKLIYIKRLTTHKQIKIEYKLQNNSNLAEITAINVPNLR